MAEVSEVLSGAARWTVVHGNCIDVVRTMPDACIDAVVTDPPYGLSREPSPKELEQIVRGWAKGENVERKVRGFMSRNWEWRAWCAPVLPCTALWTLDIALRKADGS